MISNAHATNFEHKKPNVNAIANTRVRAFSLLSTYHPSELSSFLRSTLMIRQADMIVHRKPLANGQIRANFFTLIIAGHDTIHSKQLDGQTKTR